MKWLIPSLIFFLTSVSALAEDRPRIFTELREAMTAESSSWTPAEIEKIGSQELRWRFVKTWEVAELEIAARNENFREDVSWWTPVIKRWGMVDHESALSFFLDRLCRARIEHAWPARKGHFSLRQYSEENAGYALVRIFAGWARSNPREAWQHFTDLESRHRKMGVFRDLVHQEAFIVHEMLGPLAKDHPEFVFSEFQRAGLSDDLGVEMRPYLLAGLAEGLPNDTDWAELFERLENELRHDQRPTLRVAQGPLFGRWLEADVKAAETWYESEASKAVFRASRKVWWREDLLEFEIYGNAVPLEETPIIRAALCWLLKAPEDAVKWFRDHRELIPALFEELAGSSPDANERQILRRLLVFCLHKTERERLFRQIMMVGRSSSRSSIRLLADFGDPARFQRELAELDIGDQFVAGMIKALKSKATFGDGDGAFGDIQIEEEWD
ncbi:hypothetical protein N9062_00700 [Akkermansiaceae bacterium]|nr:hypothetical protein [Akkermansiaceae bacterium]